MEYWPPKGSVEIHATVDHPIKTINLDEYTKKVQDDMMEALRVIVKNYSNSVVITTITESSGREFMERYEKWKKDEENKLLREQIDAAKKLLRENGFKVEEE